MQPNIHNSYTQVDINILKTNLFAKKNSSLPGELNKFTIGT